jgi:phosphoribosyl-ATP pyrophosphohydrolase
MTLTELYDIIRDRQQTPTTTSYTASLFQKGEDAICQKVGEEAVEVILAAKGQGRERLIEESADLAYHMLVLLAQQGVTPADVLDELERRHR